MTSLPLTLLLSGALALAPAAGGGASAADAFDVDLGLVPLQPTGGASGPVLTVVGSTGPGGFLVQVQNTPTAFAEEFLIQLPPDPSKAHPEPLLVAFHKFGSTALDIANNTTLEAECWNRNWFLVAPLGASTKSFSSIPSQLNTEFVLEWVLRRFRGYIDPERLYGVGFSMGGGNALNYAARHLDPGGPMFAAIVNHSGPVSLRYSYQETPANQFLMELWFGGSPDEEPFAYARSSVLDLHDVAVIDTPTVAEGPSGPGSSGSGGTSGGVPTVTPPELRVDSKRSLIGNLSHVPLYLVRAKLDPLIHMRWQMDALARQLALTGAPHTYKLVGGILVHSWSTLNEKQALNWLAKRRLRLPSSARTLADRDGRWFHFDVEQDEAGQMTPFEWEVRARTNALFLQETANSSRFVVDLAAAGLDPERRLVVELSSADGTGDAVVLDGLPEAPSAVLRDGSSALHWSYDASARALTIVEHDGSRPHRWVVEPR